MKKSGTIAPPIIKVSSEPPRASMMTLGRFSSMLPMGTFIFKQQKSSKFDDVSKKEKENYYKIENEEALKADPRMFAAGKTFFTPWDIA
jgi:hypothetical protein